jgi:hypothetical protein
MLQFRTGAPRRRRCSRGRRSRRCRRIHWLEPGLAGPAGASASPDLSRRRPRVLRAPAASCPVTPRTCDCSPAGEDRGHRALESRGRAGRSPMASVPPPFSCPPSRPPPAHFLSPASPMPVCPCTSAATETRGATPRSFSARAGCASSRPITPTRRRHGDAYAGGPRTPSGSSRATASAPPASWRSSSWGPDGHAASLKVGEHRRYRVAEW